MKIWPLDYAAERSQGYWISASDLKRGLEPFEQIRKACSILVDPICKGIHKLVATFDPEFQNRLKNRVLLAGGGSMVKGLDTAVEKARKMSPDELLPTVPVRARPSGTRPSARSSISNPTW